MKTLFVIVVSMILLLPGLSGCHDSDKSDQPLQEGVIFSLQWTDGTGESHGMTRGGVQEMVPGSGGSWNMDLYGRLYSTHIEITNRKHRNLGPEVIPLDKLDYVQFGDGGRVFPEAEVSQPAS